MDESINEVLLCPHLGMGDHLITCAIVRDMAKKYSLVGMLCKAHNIHTVCWMFRDVPNIEPFSIENDDDARSACEATRKAGIEVFGLGVWGVPPFDKKIWDREFYRQYGLDFQQRWNGFVVVRQPSRELEVPRHPFALVHDDPARNYHIDDSKLPKDLEILRVNTDESQNMFDWWGRVEAATELHFMESSFAILADSLPIIKARRKVIHSYVRESIAPKYQMDWQIL